MWILQFRVVVMMMVMSFFAFLPFFGRFRVLMFMFADPTTAFEKIESLKQADFLRRVDAVAQFHKEVSLESEIARENEVCF